MGGEEAGVELIGEGFEKETAEGLLDPGVDDEEAGVRLIGEELEKEIGGLLDSVVLNVEGTGCGVELFVNPCLISRLRYPYPCCAWA